MKMSDKTLSTRAVQMTLEERDGEPSNLIIAIDGFSEGTQADDPEVTLFLTQMLAMQLVSTQGGYIPTEHVEALAEPIIEVLLGHLEACATQLSPTIHA